MFPLLLKGSLIGLSVAMPMGPIGMLCLRYSLVRGKSFGMASGLGVALADGVCGALAAWGLTASTTFIENNQTWLQIIGSFFLFYFGVTTYFAKKRETCPPKANVIQTGYMRVFLFMFILTITNPLTILSLAGIYSAIGLETLEEDFLAIMLFSVGVFLGSAAWWLVISSGSSYFGNRLNGSMLHVINKASGAFIMILSLFTLGVAIKSLL